MDINIQSAVEQYLGETLGIHPTFSVWEDTERIPYAIRSAYSFSEISLCGQKLVAITPKEEAEFSPSKLAKHLSWIDQHCKRAGIFISTGLEAYNRKRLIERKVPFIIPGNQLYLPDLSIDFREHLRKIRQKRPKLSPSAQVVLLAHLLGKFSNEVWTATSLAKSLASTKMTMSRAIEDLENHDLIEARMEWREKQIHFKERGRELWLKAKPVLRSPVQKHVFVENIDWPCGTIAGLSALSENTMIAAPARKVRALTSKAWNALQTDANLRIIPEASADLAPVELEIWRYDPRVLSRDEWVDPLSLYLSLADTTDERVESALDELLEAFPWCGVIQVATGQVWKCVSHRSRCRCQPMNPSLTENAKALLLLTAPLQVGGRSNESDPVLSPGEYNKLAEQLRKLGRVPEDLLGPDQDSIVTELGPRLDPDRIRHLLERGILLGQALELWQARGIWVVCRADCHYPKRLKTRLKQYAPPVLFGVGDPDLLERGGLAVVGSRKVDDNIIAFTEELGAATAAAGHSIVSGGARGVDQASMRGALEAEGTCIGVLAERLMKMAVDSTAREALRDRRLVFVSAVDPQARFNVGNAMQRNKYIYALADVALVVNTDYQKGGTWAGAVEQLDRFHACPVFVRNGDSIPKGNQALLERGASPWPENLEGDVLQKLLENPGAFQTNGQAELLHLGLDAPAELQVEEAPQAMEASDPTQDIANGESSKGIQQEFPELNDQ